MNDQTSERVNVSINNNNKATSIMKCSHSWSNSTERERAAYMYNNKKNECVQKINNVYHFTFFPVVIVFQRTETKEGVLICYYIFILVSMRESITNQKRKQKQTTVLLQFFYVICLFRLCWCVHKCTSVCAEILRNPANHQWSGSTCVN